MPKVIVNTTGVVIVLGGVLIRPVRNQMPVPAGLVSGKPGVSGSAL
jgi:hypothetical protein